MTENENHIVITNEDLASHEVATNVQAMQSAREYAENRPIGAPAPSGGGFKAILILTGAGLLGGGLAFGATKLLYALMGEDSDPSVRNIAFTFLMALIIGTTVALVDAATTRIAEKVLIAMAIAVPVAVVIGIVVGKGVDSYYSNAIQRLWDEGSARVDNGESVEVVNQWFKNSIHLPRGIAWLLVGIAAGITVGVASRSLKRTLLTVGGGAVGGFIGGFIFDFFPSDLEIVSQLAGMGITGLLIGLSMAVLEQAARTQWIEIVEGGMAGKQFILYKSDISIGSSTSADITLIKDPTISPQHARIFAAGGRSYIESLNPGMPVSVGGVVDLRIQLKDNDYITIGKTQILYRERAGASKTVTGNVGRLS